MTVTQLDQLEQRSITTLRGVGPKTETQFARLGIRTVADLLFQWPTRYQDRTRVVPIADLQVGEQVLIEGEVTSVGMTRGRRRQMVARLHDGEKAITLRFFHVQPQQRRSISKGARLRCFGEVRAQSAGGLEMIHPECRNLLPEQMVPVDDNLIGIYPSTEGLSQHSRRKLVDQALALLSPSFELLPKGFCSEWLMIDALRYIHHPPADAPLDLLLAGRHPAQQRLIIEELMAHQLGLLQLRAEVEQQQAYALPVSRRLQTQLLAQLTFALTGAQQRVLGEIQKDLVKSRPMLRLVQGDVGCGKTVIAAMAMLQAIEQGHQVALMAPTELLVEQHARNFAAWLEPLGIKTAVLLGRQTAATRAALVNDISAGDYDVVIGTHVLFQQGIDFARLALLVIDEQHRFGVHQREALLEKGVKGGYVPHQLVMTATPIPRTLAMAAYAHLDVSVVDELPPGRQSVGTVVLADTERARLVERIHANIQQGRQVYWVCTLIDESDNVECQAAQATSAFLQTELPDVRIGLVHGRLKSAEKVAVMDQFRGHELDLLVATTVIEVGVDVPNASLLVIENAERLGLAQLHQLRGRVGRGSQQSHCVLLYQGPLSEIAEQRLQVMREHSDGFTVAEADLAMRGPGELLGSRQSGLLRLYVADIIRDAPLLPKVRELTSRLIDGHEELIEPVQARWLACHEPVME